MTNQQIWDFANKTGAQIFKRVGLISLVLSVPCYFLLPESTGIIASFIIFIIGIGVGMYWCETKINSYFDKNGNPK